MPDQIKPEVLKAVCDGYEAGKRNLPVTANPYRDNALFDSDQLSAEWLKSRKAAIDRRYAAKRRGAAHYAF